MKKILAITLTLFSLSARSQEALVHEIDASASLASFRLSGDFSQSRIGAAYHYLIAPTVQIGGSIAWDYTSNSYSSASSNTRSSMLVFAGATLNFPSDSELNRAYFAGIYLGMFHASETAKINKKTILDNSESEIAFELIAGKRFVVGDNFTYKPSVAVQKVEGYDFAFLLTPVAFSYLF